MKHISIVLLSFMTFYFLNYTVYKLVHGINWNNMISFRIYDAELDKPPDSLTNIMLDSIEYIEADPVEARRLLKRADKLIYHCFIWKGKRLAVATFKNGERRNILISNYGGVFLDVKYNCFYEFKGQAKQDWDYFIQKTLGKCAIIEQPS